MIYVYFFIKSVVDWFENSVRFDFFMGIASQMSQILWDFIYVIAKACQFENLG